MQTCVGRVRLLDLVKLFEGLLDSIFLLPGLCFLNVFRLGVHGDHLGLPGIRLVTIGDRCLVALTLSLSLHALLFLLRLIILLGSIPLSCSRAISGSESTAVLLLDDSNLLLDDGLLD